MKTSEHLRAAKALISTPEKWTQNAFAVNDSGYEVGSLDADACAWCALGAVDATCEDEGASLGAKRYLSRTACDSVPLFNDDPSTTHADAMALFDRAIALAESEGR